MFFLRNDGTYMSVTVADRYARGRRFKTRATLHSAKHEDKTVLNARLN